MALRAGAAQTKRRLKTGRVADQKHVWVLPTWSRLVVSACGSVGQRKRAGQRQQPQDIGCWFGCYSPPFAGTDKKLSRSTQYDAQRVMSPDRRRPVQFGGSGPGVHSGWPAPISSMIARTAT